MSAAGFVAFLIAALITARETATHGPYARTPTLLLRCKAFWARLILYGLIASGAMLGLDQLKRAGTVKFQGVILGSVLANAIAVGLSTNALRHIRLFNVQIASQAFPIGLESVVQLFDPWLRRSIELCHFNAIRRLIAPRITPNMGLTAIRDTISTNIPRTFSDEEHKLMNAARITQPMGLPLAKRY